MIESAPRPARRMATILLLWAALAGRACTSEDVGESEKSGTGTTSGVSGQAAGGSVGGAAGLDTAGGRVNTSPSGSLVVPGPGGVPGAAGARAADTAVGKSKSAKP